MKYLILYMVLFVCTNAWQVTKPFKAPTSKSPGWHPIGFSNKIKDVPQRVEFNNEDGGFKALVVWRTPTGEILAIPDVCPHLGAKLSFGTILEDGNLQCPYHGLKVGPSSDCKITQEMHGICQEANGLVWWNNNKDEKYFKFCQDLNDLPKRKDTIVSRWEMKVKTSFSDCFRNGMDLHHAGWLHASTFGNKFKDPDGIEIDWIDEKTMRADFTYYSNENYEKLTGGTTSNYHLFQEPSTTWNKVLNGDKSKFVFIHIAMRSISPEETYWYLSAASNYIPEFLPEEISKLMLERITRKVAMMEDRTQLENMESEEEKNKFAYKIALPLDEIYNAWYRGPVNISNNWKNVLSKEEPLNIKIEKKNLNIPDSVGMVHYFRSVCFKTDSIEYMIEKAFLSKNMENFINDNKGDLKMDIYKDFVFDRMKIIDEYIIHRINQKNIENLVILGSAGDSRSYRFRNFNIKIFEIDCYNNIEIKKMVVDQYSHLKINNVEYKSYDLNKEIPSEIKKDNTLVVGEGLTFNLDEKTVENLLKNCNEFIGDFLITKPPQENFKTIVKNPSNYLESFGFKNVKSIKIKGLFGTIVVSGIK